VEFWGNTKKDEKKKKEEKSQTNQPVFKTFREKICSTME
jgi:hypothetical protein